jgi:RNA polymerase sigma-70 factor, ECF subfamily
MTGSADGGADEQTLIELAKRDRAAFGRLYEQHLERIYNYVYYRTGNVADAEDLTSRVFFKALQHIDGFQYQGVPFSAWLYRIARNLLANWYRDRSKRQTVPLSQMNSGFVREGPESEVESAESKEALLAAIARLPADRQELLILKHVERLSNSEIGQILGRSEGAVKALYYRTLRSLHGELAQGPSDTDVNRPASSGEEAPTRWLRWRKTRH